MLQRTRCRTGQAVVLVLSMIAALPAGGQTVYEDIKLVSNNASPGDSFGVSVAISGTTAVVGANNDDDAGLNSGSAYLFDTITGEQLFMLTAWDARAGARLGYSVAISGKVAIAGAILDDALGPQSGSAYLFDTTTGEQLFKLTASDGAPGDWFGSAVAISGAVAVVGSLYNDTGLSSGSAYLFDVASGEQLFKLAASDGLPGDGFGSAVAISGATVIVGSRYDFAGVGLGSAYLFDAGTGEQLAKLTALDAAFGDDFGIAVAVSGTTAIVGAMGDGDAGANSGSAYVFDTTTGEQLFKLTASDASAGDRFGRSVAISGTTAIVGAWSSDDAGDSTGSAYVFDTITGQQIAKMTASDASAGDMFGYWVAISGERAIIGAYGNDDAGDSSGSAYLITVADVCLVDLNNDGSLNFFDVSVFLEAFAAGDSVADFTGDGRFNFFDVSAFLAAFSAGCP